MFPKNSPLYNEILGRDDGDQALIFVTGFSNQKNRGRIIAFALYCGDLFC
jgi:hypothetical protein